jgi:hypothetical protein
MMGLLPQVSLLAAARRREAGLAFGAEQDPMGREVREARGHRWQGLAAVLFPDLESRRRAAGGPPGILHL